MARFDVYRYEDGYLLDVQADILDGLNSRMVVPLMPSAKAPKPADRLNPVFIVGEDEFVMVTQFMAAVPVRDFGKPVGSLEQEYDRIKLAIDMLFDGF
jgi:toxin CcdB